MRQALDTIVSWFLRSRARMILALVVCFIVVGVLKAVLMLLYISDSASHTTIVVLDGIMAGGLSALCVAALLLTLRSRRRRILNYMRQVDSLNHHVRNALQTIVLHAEATAEERASLDAVHNSVRRIDETLRDAFPMIGDRKTDRGKTFHDLTD
jgi:hypothetical protein